MAKRYTRILFLFFILATGSSNLHAQPADLNHIWAAGIGSGPQTGDAGISVATDKAGNSYYTGRFNGTIDFDPGPDSAGLTSNGSRDVFFAKYDANGKYIWARNVGNSSTLHDDGSSIAVDDSGNVYVAGFFSGKVDFDPGTAPGDTAFLTAPTLANRYNGMFFAKYDSNGHYVWAKAITGINRPITIGENYAIALDHKGSLYLTGAYVSTDRVDFDPGPDTAWLPTALASYIFFARYSTDGDFRWAQVIIGPSGNVATAIVADHKRGIYLTGAFGGAGATTTDFDPGPDTANLVSNGLADIFVAHYDTNGAYKWAINMGAPLADAGYALATDSNANVYVTGVFRGLADFDPGPDSFQIRSINNTNDIFLAKYDSTGKFQWAKAMGCTGSTGTAQGNGLALDQYANVYITGTFADTVDFDPGPDSVKIGRAGVSSTDIFVAKYDSSGNYINARNMGGTGADVGAAIAVTPVGVVYTTGSFSATANFNIGGAAPANIISKGGIDIFIASMGCAQATDYTHITCDSSYTLNGTTYDKTGRYVQRYTNAAGCDSLINLNLSINYTVPVWRHETTCDSFLFHGNVYREAGIYADTFINISGCDSIINLSLSVLTSDTTLTVTACDSLILNGEAFTTTGTHTQVHTNATGCDSTITLHLTIHDSPEATVAQTGIMLAAGSADSYQWIDCNNNGAIIPGATGQIFEPVQTGSYAVVVTADNGCTDTSECHPVEIANDHVPEFAGKYGIQLYPNPTDGRVMLKSTAGFHAANIRLLNITGQVLEEWSNATGREIMLDIRNHTAGIYFIEIATQAHTAQFRLVKE